MQSQDSVPQGISAPTEQDKRHGFVMHTVSKLADKHVTMFTEMSTIQISPVQFWSVNLSNAST